MALMEFLYRDDEDTRLDEYNFMLSRWGTRENVQVLLDLNEKWDGRAYNNMLGGTPANNPNRDGTARIVTGQETFSEAMQSITPEIQGILDDLFN